MKLFLFLLVSCLALINVKDTFSDQMCCEWFRKSHNGAPRTATYKFVQCNPNGDQTNCVVQQTPPMPWSPELPSKLPASTAQYLEAEPVEDESSPSEEEDDYEAEMEEEETPMESEDGESPSVAEESFGNFEGSSEGTDLATAAKIDIGSGDFGTETELKDGDMSTMKRFFSSTKVVKPSKTDLEEDHLLKI